MVRKKLTSGPALPGKLADCTAGSQPHRAVPGGRGLGRRIGQRARDREYQAIVPLKGRSSTWVSSDEVLASQEVPTSPWRSLDPDSGNLSQLRYGKICILADETPMVCTSPRCSVRCS